MGITIKSPFDKRANFELEGIKRIHSVLLRDYNRGKKRREAGEIFVLVRTKYYTCQLFNDNDEFTKFLKEYVTPFLKKNNLKIFVHDRYKKVIHVYGKPSHVKIAEWAIGVTLE